MKLSEGTESALAFFLVAVSYKTPWTAISSLLGQLSQQHGPQVLLQLNLAYFLPPMPLLYILSALQGPLDRALGARRSAQLRFFLGLGGLSLLSLAFPSAAAAAAARGGAAPLLALTAGVGAAYAVAFGTSYQLAPCFGPACTVALTTGFVSAGVVVLVLDLAIKRGAPHYTQGQLSTLFRGVAAACACGLAAASALLRRHMPRLEAQGRIGSGGGGSGGGGSSSGGREAAAKAVHARGHGGGDGMRHRPDAGEQWQQPHPHHVQDRHAHHQPQPQQQHSRQQRPDSTESVDVEAGAGDRHQHRSSAGGGGAALSPPRRRAPSARGAGGTPGAAAWRRAARGVAPAAAAICVSVGSSMMAFPFFSYMPLDGALGQHLVPAAFYARLLGDIAGRLAPPRLQAATLRRLAGAAVVKAALLPVLLIGLVRPAAVGGDLLLVALVAANWVLSGYVNTGAYLVAPSLAPQHRERVGGIMALAFQVSCFLGLMAATAVQQVLHSHMFSGAPGSMHAPGGGHVAPAAGMAVAAASAAAAAAAAGGTPSAGAPLTGRMQ